MKKKTAALFLALALVVGATIGGTIAWLTDTSDEVVNTFTTSDVDITLTETDADKDKDANKNSYQMVPGCTIEKDPKVTVATGSEECWLFVKLEKSDNFDTYMTYEIADDWTPLGGVENVYYRHVTTDRMGENNAYTVLKNNQVTVKNDVTKEQMNALEKSQTYPTLTVTAYASQYMKDNTNNLSALDAWNNVPKD